MPAPHPPPAKGVALTAAACPTVPASSERMPLPAGVMPFQPDWPNIVLITFYHLAALAAFLPIYFNWSGLIVAVVRAQISGLLGINLCYHPLVTPPRLP